MKRTTIALAIAASLTAAPTAMAYDDQSGFTYDQESGYSNDASFEQQWDGVWHAHNGFYDSTAQGYESHTTNLSSGGYEAQVAEQNGVRWDYNSDGTTTTSVTTDARCSSGEWNCWATGNSNAWWNADGSAAGTQVDYAEWGWNINPEWSPEPIPTDVDPTVEPVDDGASIPDDDWTAPEVVETVVPESENNQMPAENNPDATTPEEPMYSEGEWNDTTGDYDGNDQCPYGSEWNGAEQVCTEGTDGEHPSGESLPSETSEPADTDSTATPEAVESSTSEPTESSEPKESATPSDVVTPTTETSEIPAETAHTGINVGPSVAAATILFVIGGMTAAVAYHTRKDK